MRVATILPKPLLNTKIDEDYNMCLYHVCKENAEYANHFRKLRDDGKFVIMDNGAAEGVNPTAEELMAVYPLVNPSEIVLPDIVYDKEETLNRSRQAYGMFLDNNLQMKYQFMAVPQGQTFSEWTECMQEMIRQPFITTLGVSKFVTPKYQDEMGQDANVRLECVDAILEEAKRVGRDIQIHLLGCWSNPKEIGQIEREFGDKVRGTDSAIAYVYARAGVVYDPNTNRPDNDEIDFIEGNVGEYESLLYSNIHDWVEYCNGK